MSEKAPTKHNKMRNPEKQAHHEYHAPRTNEGLARAGLREAVKNAVPTSTLQEELTREIEATLAPQEQSFAAAEAPVETIATETVPTAEIEVEPQPYPGTQPEKEEEEDEEEEVEDATPVLNASSDQLSEESAAMLAIEAEDTEGVTQIAPAPAPTPVEAPAAPATTFAVPAPMNLYTAPELYQTAPIPEQAPEAKPEQEAKTEYAPKTGDIAEQNGEKVRLERALTADGERVGYEVTKRDGSLDLAPNTELTFIDPEKETERIAAELKELWAKNKNAMQQNFRPSYMEQIWFDVYENDTVNFGIDGGTNPDDAVQMREQNRRALIAGEAGLMFDASYRIQHSGDFVIETPTQEQVPVSVGTASEVEPIHARLMPSLSTRRSSYIERNERR